VGEVLRFALEVHAAVRALGAGGGDALAATGAFDLSVIRIRFEFVEWDRRIVFHIYYAIVRIPAIVTSFYLYSGIMTISSADSYFFPTYEYG